MADFEVRITIRPSVAGLNALGIESAVNSLLNESAFFKDSVVRIETEKVEEA